MNDQPQHDKAIPRVPGAKTFDKSKWVKITQERRSNSNGESNNSDPLRFAGLEDAIPDPDFGSKDHETTKSTDEELDEFIDNIKFHEAYNKWIDKDKIPPPTKEDGNIIRCPWPGHEDKNPQAFYNKTKKTFYCSKCGKGGDIYDLAAIRFGMEDDYKRGAKFHELRRKMAEDYGWIFNKNAIGRYVGKSPGRQRKEVKKSLKITSEPEPEHEPEPIGVTPITHIANKLIGKFNWKELVDSGSAMDTYMQDATKDSSPEEYHFSCVLSAISLIAGRRIRLNEGRRVVQANIGTLLVGRSGIGKSESIHFLKNVCREVAPFCPKDPDDKGIYLLPNPGSGEALIKLHTYYDVDSKGKPTGPGYDGFESLLYIEEFSEFSAKGGRLGSTLTENLMKFLDDDGRNQELISSYTIGKSLISSKNQFLNFIAGVQPDIVSDVTTQKDKNSGFLSRIQPVGGNFKHTGNGIDDDTPDSSRASIEFNKIRRWSFQVQKENKSIKWSDKAKTLYSNFYRDVLQKEKEEGSPLLSKMDLRVKKIAMIHTINRMEEEINSESVEYAIKLHPYLKLWCIAFDSEIGKTIIGNLESDILDWIRKKDHSERTPPSTNQIATQFRTRHPKGAGGIQDTLKSLDCVGLIFIDKEGPQHHKGPGRPKIDWVKVIES